MYNVDEHDFKVKIHDGWLIATESADKLSRNGNFLLERRGNIFMERFDYNC